MVEREPIENRVTLNYCRGKDKLPRSYNSNHTMRVYGFTRITTTILCSVILFGCGSKYVEPTDGPTATLAFSYIGKSVIDQFHTNYDPKKHDKVLAELHYAFGMLNDKQCFDLYPPVGINNVKKGFNLETVRVKSGEPILVTSYCSATCGGSFIPEENKTYQVSGSCWVSNRTYGYPYDTVTHACRLFVKSDDELVPLTKTFADRFPRGTHCAVPNS